MEPRIKKTLDTLLSEKGEVVDFKFTENERYAAVHVRVNTEEFGRIENEHGKLGTYTSTSRDALYLVDLHKETLVLITHKFGNLGGYDAPHIIKAEMVGNKVEILTKYYNKPIIALTRYGSGEVGKERKFKIYCDMNGLHEIEIISDKLF